MAWHQKRTLAERLGLDLAEISDYEYQPGRHGKTVVLAVSDFYWCATKPNRLPAGYEWTPVPDAYVEAHTSLQIFKASAP